LIGSKRETAGKKMINGLSSVQYNRRHESIACVISDDRVFPEEETVEDAHIIREKGEADRGGVCWRG
jgi:hypothetical protein